MAKAAAKRKLSAKSAMSRRKFEEAKHRRGAGGKFADKPGAGDDAPKKGKVGKTAGVKDTDVIRIHAKGNPKKGTAAVRYNHYKDGMTVKDYIDAVGDRKQALRDMAWDRKQGWISFHDPADAGNVIQLTTQTTTAAAAAATKAADDALRRAAESAAAEAAEKAARIRRGEVGTLLAKKRIDNEKITDAYRRAKPEEFRRWRNAPDGPEKERIFDEFRETVARDGLPVSSIRKDPGATNEKYEAYPTRHEGINIWARPGQLSEARQELFENAIDRLPDSVKKQLRLSPIQYTGRMNVADGFGRDQLTAKSHSKLSDALGVYHPERQTVGVQDSKIGERMTAKTLLHEIGHAVDNEIGKRQFGRNAKMKFGSENDPTFRRLYNEAKARWNPRKHSDLTYYQTNMKEMFAEGFAAVHDDPNSVLDRTKRFQEAFGTEILDHIRKMVKDFK